uniref:Chemokine interleukin-8-like domain-containing protein n=1 Tax=Denticeps clupeoides TaxID=299321 RepID=A0AAY3ZY13_9TELE
HPVPEEAMKFYALLFLVLLTCLYLTTAQGSYEDCCLKYVKTVKPAIKRRVTQYRLQELDGGCNIPAVVFTLKYGRVMCADPKQPWVKNINSHTKCAPSELAQKLLHFPFM